MIEIVNNVDVTTEFNLRCFYRAPGVILKRSKLFTHNLIVKVYGVKIMAKVQTKQSVKGIIFLN